MKLLTDKLIERWNTRNIERIERALSVMNKPSQKVFNLLPALLHCNHPKLPGYIENSPHGIFQFEQDQDLTLLTKTFKVKLNQLTPTKAPQILSLFCMGSTSTVGQSYSSDIDVWVCISSKMSAAKRKKLTQKCHVISLWAKKSGVVIDLFLMDENRFRKNVSGVLSDEDCGSSQHLILLDEFYRTALRMAGLRLLWRVIPPEMEPCYDEYAQRLYDSGAINKNQWMDFGPLCNIPAAEYFGSSLWQLYKSIDSPYKSVMKAILLESYTWEYPYPRLLSLESKRRFFSHQPDIDSLDGYHLKLEKVTRYLTAIGDFERLDLVRRCFYLKTHEKLSRSLDIQRVPWRHSLMKRLVKEWQWPDEKIKMLDERGHWKVEQVSVMHQDLLDALMKSYRHLLHFAEKHNITATISPEDISILSRKLYASFETLPDKVTLLNNQISSDLSEAHLTFIEVEDGRCINKGWYLYKAPLDNKSFIGQKPLKHHESLVKLIAWAYFNGLLNKKTQIHAQIQNDKFTIAKIRKMIRDLQRTFDIERTRPTLEALSSPCELNQIAVFINFETDNTLCFNRTEIKSLPQMLRMSNQSLTIISSIDIVYRNSWQEIWTLHTQGDDAVIDMLKMMLSKMHQNATTPDPINVFCYTKRFSKEIKQRVINTITECIELRLQPIKSAKHRRFKVLRIANKLYGLFFETRGVSVIKLDNAVDFYSNLSNNKLKGAALKVVEGEKNLAPSLVDSLASEGLVQLFFEDDEDGFNVYILNESNQLDVYRQFDGTKEDVIKKMNHYYTHTNCAYAVDQVTQFNLPQYYQVIHPDNGDSYVIPYRSC